jgi:hypothetical protein
LNVTAAFHEVKIELRISLSSSFENRVLRRILVMKGVK